MKFFFFLLSFFLQYLVHSQNAKFGYQFHNSEIKGGKFTYVDPQDSLSFEAEASAGFLVGANNPFLQATKNVGPIPNGTWEIFGIKSEDKFTLWLRATDDVVITTRDGFLIHGTGVDKTPERSSLGCIIISDREARKKLVKALKKYGLIKLKVTNIVTGDGVKG